MAFLNRVRRLQKGILPTHISSSFEKAFAYLASHLLLYLSPLPAPPIAAHSLHHLLIKVSIRPVKMEASITQVVLNIDGQYS